MNLLNGKQLIILDRDGVINYDSDNYIKSADEWIPIPGSLEAIAKLNKAGYKVAIATNQSGIARGYYSLNTLNQMHQKMQLLLANIDGKINHISYCPHGPESNCNCRKPRSGMLEDIMNVFSYRPEKSIFIGDSMTDMQAAKAANMEFLLVQTGKGKKTLHDLNQTGIDISGSIHDSLEAIVNTITQ